MAAATETQSLRRSDRFGKRIAALLAGITLAALLAGPSWARTEQLRWTHPNASTVTGFLVQVGSSSRNYNQTINVGKPSASGGVYTFNLSVADSSDIYVAVRAYNSEGNSPHSNERFLQAPAAPPPPPPASTGTLGRPGKPTVQ